MSALWPELPLEAWRDTRDTLHRYAQIVGKIQLALTPLVNHFWNVTLRPTARGLATSAMPYEGRTIDLELDFVGHALVLRSSDGQLKTLALQPRTVANFYAEVMAMLASAGVHVEIWDHPVEIPTDAIPFPRDRMHAAYDPEWAARFWRILLQTAAVMAEFRSRFLGKASDVIFYWGTFDLAAARYSGRRAPNPPQTSVLEREGYSHEVSEVGFWPGDTRYGEAAFYTLQWPAPEGYAGAQVRPAAATWSAAMNCFLLPYEAVRSAPSPRALLLDFFQSTYEAGADLARWDRAELERPARASASAQPAP